MIPDANIHTVDGWSDFVNQLKITHSEMLSMLSSAQREELCEYENEHRRKNNKPTINDPEDAADELLTEYCATELSIEDLIQILETRHGIYVPNHDGYGVFTIVEIPAAQKEAL